VALAEPAGEERSWVRAWHVPTRPALPVREMTRLPPRRGENGPGHAYGTEFTLRATPLDEQIRAALDWRREPLAATS